MDYKVKYKRSPFNKNEISEIMVFENGYTYVRKKYYENKEEGYKNRKMALRQKGGIK